MPSCSSSPNSPPPPVGDPSPDQAAESDDDILIIDDSDFRVTKHPKPLTQAQKKARKDKKTLHQRLDNYFQSCRERGARFFAAK